MTRPRVIQLDAHTANQIAAGEVVARPASVIKELLENALDAEAKSIAIDIEGGGLRSMRVRDDGMGMNEQDARMALQRHATSKLRSAEDLQTLTTLGFRGEALPSIASVSKFRLQTRPVDRDAGTEIRLTGGKDLRVGPCGCAPGTIIEVNELFFNVPARKKFMRAIATESAHITDAVRAVALAHPEVAVAVQRDSRKHRRWPAAAGRHERAAAVYSDYKLMAIVGQRGPVQVEAHLSAPERARSGTGGLQVLINRRAVSDRAIARAIASGYGQSLERGRYPVGVIFVDIDPALIDVNVHPQKAEVRFAHARAVSDAVYAIVGDAMAKQLGATPSRQPHRFSKALRPAAEEGSWAWPATAGAAPERLADSAGSPAAQPQPAPVEAVEGPAQHFAHEARGPLRHTQASQDGSGAPEASAQQPQTPTEPDDGKRIEWLATVDAFWLCRQARTLLVLDPVRVLRCTTEQKLLRQYRNKTIPAQRQLFPLRQELSPDKIKRIESEPQALERLGFDLRVVGPGLVAAHALPLALSTVEPAAMLQALLEAKTWDESLIPRLCAMLVANVALSPADLRSQLAQWSLLMAGPGRHAIRHRVELESLR